MFGLLPLLYLSATLVKGWNFTPVLSTMDIYSVRKSIRAVFLADYI